MWRVRDRGTFEALGRSPAQAVGPLRLRAVVAEPGPPRVAYAVGRAVGNAVERNRIRRRLRAVVSEHRALLRPDSAYLFSVGPRAATMTTQALSEAVSQLLGTAWEQ